MKESKYLKDAVGNVSQLLELEIPIFRNFDSRDLPKLLKLSKIRRYEDGELIIKEGNVDDWFYILLSGAVNISKSGVDINQLHEKGELFGEMRLVDGLGRSTSVHSVGNTICFAVNFSAAYRLAPVDNAESLMQLLYKAISESLAARLRLSNEAAAIRAKVNVATSETQDHPTP